MLSRVADSLYWMSRNCERTEHNAHILSMQLIKMLETSEQEMGELNEWETLVEICSTKHDFYSYHPFITVEGVVNYLTFSKENMNSMVNTVQFARENARITRDSIPNELWEVWNEFYLHTKDIQSKQVCSLKDIHHFLNTIKKASFTATGVIDSLMERDLPYHFMKIGKWVERAEKTALILLVFFQRARQEQKAAADDFFWRSILQFVNGGDAFFKRFSPIINQKNVLQFLVTDLSFPRSIRYCTEHIWEAVKELERGKVSHYSWQMYALLDTMMAEFTEDFVKNLAEEEIEAFLIQTLNRCVEFGKIFSNTYYLIEREHSI